MIPLLTTCCCGIVSVRTAALLVAALFIFGCGVHLFVNILDASGAINTIYRHRGCIDVMIINIVSIVVNILLIVGIEKRKLSLMKPAAVFYLVVAAFFFVVMCQTFFLIPDSGWLSLVLVVMVSVIAIFCYFWLIVYSHYRQLENELMASSGGEELNSPLAVASYPCPKYEDESEFPHHGT